MILETVLRLIAPHACLACGSEGALICKDCQPNIVVKKASTCYRCNRISPVSKTCNRCRSSSKLAGVAVASHYEGVIKELIGGLKYERTRSAAPILANLITPLLVNKSIDVITCVPVATNHYRQRGYNQAELIAKKVAAALALPYSPLLSRVSNVQQVGSKRADRLKQVHGAFAIRKKIEGQKVLIIDDVLTTGATLNECALVLRAAGAKSVWGAVAAKH